MPVRRVRESTRKNVPHWSTPPVDVSTCNVEFSLIDLSTNEKPQSPPTTSPRTTPNRTSEPFMSIWSAANRKREGLPVCHDGVMPGLKPHSCARAGLAALSATSNTIVNTRGIAPPTLRTCRDRLWGWASEGQGVYQELDERVYPNNRRRND